MGVDMIEVCLYEEDEGYEHEVLWVQQAGYDGAWLTPDDPRFAKLKPVMDLLPENDPRDILWTFGWIKTIKITTAEWDAITDGALVP